jgi:hypothetical protein
VTGGKRVAFLTAGGLVLVVVMGLMPVLGQLVAVASRRAARAARVVSSGSGTGTPRRDGAWGGR